MKILCIILGCLSAVLAMAVAHLLLTRRLSVLRGPGSYLTVQTKLGDALLLSSASSPISVEWIDAGPESSFSAKFESGNRSVLINGFLVSGQFRVNSFVTTDVEKVLYKDTNGDGVPDSSWNQSKNPEPDNINK